jgi:hypothetical protein
LRNDARTSDERRTPMRKAVQANETPDDHPAGAATHEGTLSVGPGIPFVGNLIRRARLRTRKAVDKKVLEGTISARARRQDPGSDAARSSMEAGLTRGVSLLFGEFGSRR